MADLNKGFESFEEFWQDSDVQDAVQDIKSCLRCDNWQAAVVLLLINNQTVDIRPPHEDEDWKGD